MHSTNKIRIKPVKGILTKAGSCLCEPLVSRRSSIELVTANSTALFLLPGEDRPTSDTENHRNNNYSSNESAVWTCYGERTSLGWYLPEKFAPSYQ